MASRTTTLPLFPSTRAAEPQNYACRVYRSAVDGLDVFRVVDNAEHAKRFGWSIWHSASAKVAACKFRRLRDAQTAARKLAETYPAIDWRQNETEVLAAYENHRKQGAPIVAQIVKDFPRY